MQGPTPSAAAPGLTLQVSGDSSLSLRTGETVRAEIVANDRTSTFVRIRGALIEARSDVPLKTGDVLSVRVERQGDQVLLRVAGPARESTASRASQPALVAGSQVPRSAAGPLADLKALLEKMPEGALKGLPALAVVRDFLKAMGRTGGLPGLLRDSGIFLEAKLRLIAQGRDPSGLLDLDLKAALLRIRDSLAGKTVMDHLRQLGVKKPGGLSTAVEELLSTIEECQIRSRLTDALLVFVPVPGERLRDGTIFFRRSGSGPGEESAFLCGLLLDLSPGGRIRTDLFLRKGMLHASITAEDGTFSEVLKNSEEELKKQFSAAGLSLSALTVRQGEVRDGGTAPFDGVSIRA